MYTVFVTGGIGSGKSAVRAILASLPGVEAVDLDALGRTVLERPDVKRDLAEAFGGDVLIWHGWADRPCDGVREEGYGGLPDRLVEPYEAFVDYGDADVDRALLAERAFASPDGAEALGAITHPRIIQALGELVCGGCACMGSAAELLVVEVPLIDRAGESLALADEVVAVAAPVSLRRERAIGRGMDGADFDARDVLQIDDAQRASIAHTVIENSGTYDELRAAVLDWFERRRAGGWVPPRRDAQAVEV